VAEDGDRDRYFTAEEAKEYGLVDEVFKPKEPEKPGKDDKAKDDKKKDEKKKDS
jgi:ATP-dependent Clp protease protease subunit